MVNCARYEYNRKWIPSFWELHGRCNPEVLCQSRPQKPVLQYRVAARHHKFNIFYCTYSFPFLSGLWTLIPVQKLVTVQLKNDLTHVSTWIKFWQLKNCVTIWRKLFFIKNMLFSCMLLFVWKVIQIKQITFDFFFIKNK